MTAIAGVAVIAFSSLPLLSNFGLFVALKIAIALLAALVGVTTVGLVDSLLDMPRITLFLTLLLWLGLTLRRPENSTSRHEPASGQ